MIEKIKQIATKIKGTAIDMAQIGFYLTVLSFPITGPVILFYGSFAETGYDRKINTINKENKKTLANCSQLDSKLRELFDENKDRIFSSLELRTMIDKAGYHGLIDQNTSFRVYDPSMIIPETEYRTFKPLYGRSDTFGDIYQINIPLETAIRLIENE